MQLWIENLPDMAPSDTQFEKLRDRVKTLKKNPGQGASVGASWVQRNQVLTWLISLTIGLTTILTSILIGFYAGVIPHIEKDDALEIAKQVSEGLKGPSQQIQQTSQDIAVIKTRLDDWAPFIVPEILKRHSSMNQDEFNRSLASLRNAVQIAAQARAIVPNEIVQKIAQKLRQTSESSPEYWPTVLQFIQFATASLIAPTDVPPASTQYSMASNINCAATMHCMKLSHCAIILDGGHIPNSIFDHCRIKFTSNPVGLEGTRFIDCVFEIPTDITQPTPYLKNSAKILLASNLRQVTFPDQTSQ